MSERGLAAAGSGVIALVVDFLTTGGDALIAVVSFILADIDLLVSILSYLSRFAPDVPWLDVTLVDQLYNIAALVILAVMVYRLARRYRERLS